MSLEWVAHLPVTASIIIRTGPPIDAEFWSNLVPRFAIENHQLK